MKIWVNGCFDILHTGHLDLLEYAKYQAEPQVIHTTPNILIIGIDSDRRIKELKGKNRPINFAEDRKRMLMSLRVVSEVHIFDTADELRQLIKDLEIDLMVDGEEYRYKEVIGSENSKYGVVYYQTDNRSTTNLIKKLKINE